MTIIYYAYVMSLHVFPFVYDNVRSVAAIATERIPCVGTAVNNIRVHTHKHAHAHPRTRAHTALQLNTLRVYVHEGLVHMCI